MAFTAQSGNLTDEITQKLSELAIELSTNYCTASFSEDEKQSVVINDIFTEKTVSKLKKTGIPGDKFYVSNIHQHRNILIVGAGATHDSYKCIPLGKKVIDELCKERGYEKELIVREFKQSRRLKGESERDPDFEQMLAVLTQEKYYGPTELRKQISKFADFRYCPSLFYEIVAHLFKHSFIDVIINFNFDELLDNVIAEEVGKENYFHILSDGDCVSLDEIMVDGRLKIPVYIKPHGTVRHKSSLRFTKEQYIDIPEQIRVLLKDLIEGNRQCQPVIDKVNLICVGFNMASIEIMEMLDKYLPGGSKIYHFAYEKNDSRGKPFFLQEVLPSFYERAGDYNLNNTKFEKGQQFHDSIYIRIPVEGFISPELLNGFSTPYAEVFSYLWRQIYSHFKDDLQPRSIGRHEIISYLFYNTDFSKTSTTSDHTPLLNNLNLQIQHEKNVDYFLDRTIVEIALALNRNNGIAELAQLLNDRVGIYFSLYQNAFFEKNKKYEGSKSIYDLLRQFESKTDITRTEKGFFPKGIFQLDKSILKDLKKDTFLKNIKNGKGASNNYSNLDDRLQRWRIVHNNSNDAGYELIMILLQKFSDLLFLPDYCNPVTTVILYRLFTCKLLSGQFVDNFKKNYDKIIYNGKLYSDVKYFRFRKKGKNRCGIEMIDELIRLFDKSERSSVGYFSIRPKFNDPKNFLSESFSRSRLLHTNLALEYNFRKLFLQHLNDWDIAFIISEKSSCFGFLEYLTEKKDFSGKQIVVINAYEAIKQLHSIDEKRVFAARLNDLNTRQQSIYIKQLNKAALKRNSFLIDTYSLPANQHNHHLMLFVKKERGANLPIYVYERKKPPEETCFGMIGAIYMYRQGFSNSINPLFIGKDYYTGNNTEKPMENDFKKLLRIVSKIYCRAIRFKEFPESDDIDTDFKDYLGQMLDK